MNNIRIIPRLDIKGPNLVKGIHLEGLRVLGTPEDFAKYYYENGADELIFQDIVASLYERNSLHDIVSRTAKNIFIPLTVGGGLRTIDDINNVLRAGADKVSINTGAVRNKSFIREASRKFGSSTIVVAIEAIKQANGEYYCFIDNGREETGIEVTEWAREIEELGAGELIITSVDREGTGEGFDIDLIKKITSNVNIPVIAHGGAGSMENIKSAVHAGADGLAIATVFHYKTINEISNTHNAGSEGNTTFLKSNTSRKIANVYHINDVKQYLQDNEISCRRS